VSPPMGPRPYPGVVPRTLGETETDRFSPRRLPVIDQAESSEGDHWSLTVSDVGVGDAGGGGTVPRDRRRGGGTRGGPREPPRSRSGVGSGKNPRRRAVRRRPGPLLGALPGEVPAAQAAPGQPGDEQLRRLLGDAAAAAGPVAGAGLGQDRKSGV